MRTSSFVSVLVAAICAAGCDNTLAPSGQTQLRAAYDASDNPSAGITGGGQYSLAGLPGKFSVSAIQHPDGATTGEFRQFVDEGGGVVVDFHASVTCMAVDPVNHRGWVGGIITENRSTDPGFLTPIQQPGRDIWFRVLDGGNGEGDRLTFTGFQGSAGFLTSAAYCAGQPWPAGNARTWAVTAGNIDIRP
jgi:hypothetical protein